MKSDRKPPLVRSPLHLRPRRSIRSTATPMRTPLPASATKIRMPPKEVGGIRPEYRMISSEINDLDRMVQEELRKASSRGGRLGGCASPKSAFARGRFYDEYSARRDERLKRKLGCGVSDDEEVLKTGRKVAAVEESARKEVILTKKRMTVKKSKDVLVERSEHPRYSLRSMKKPPLPVPMMMSVETTATRNSRSRRN